MLQEVGIFLHYKENTWDRGQWETLGLELNRERYYIQKQPELEVHWWIFKDYQQISILNCHSRIPDALKYFFGIKIYLHHFTILFSPSNPSPPRYSFNLFFFKLIACTSF